MASTTCKDCGEPTAGGMRCKHCHGAFIRRVALTQTTDRDRELLAMVAADNLAGQRLADRLGVSRTRAQQLITKAREREERRRALGIRQ